MSHEEYVTSVGELGTEGRSYSRWYRNSEVLDNPDAIVDQFENLVLESQVQDTPLGGESFSRTVLRGIASNDVLLKIQSSDELAGDLEAAVPLQEFGHQGWLIYLARNNEDRGNEFPSEQLSVVRQEQSKSNNVTPLQRVRRALSTGGSFVSTIDTDDIPRLFNMWGPVFDWKENKEDPQITALAKRLEDESSLPMEKRNLWFAASYHGGHMVTASMAELLVLPGETRPVNLVESTEWVAEEAPRGFMTATLAYLNSQVMESLRGHQNGPPLIFAECNVASRADRVARGAGFWIPPAYYAPQTLRQNVEVGDGNGPKGRRDFSLNIVPRTVLESGYAPDQTAAILEEAHARRQVALV